MTSPTSAPAVSNVSLESVDEDTKLLDAAEAQLKRFDRVSEALERDVRELRVLAEQVPTEARLQRLVSAQADDFFLLRWDASQSAQLDVVIAQERVTENTDRAGWQRVAHALGSLLRLDDKVAPETLAEACQARYLALEAYRKRADWADDQLTTVLLGLDAIPGVSRQALLTAHQQRRTAQAKRISALIGRRKKLIERCLSLEMELEQQRTSVGLGTALGASEQGELSTTSTSHDEVDAEEDKSLSRQ
ncbi:hypothetical protein CCYA_CCYA08G2385 [Cyanidiococcus yangmingshanensis]|nr:hypothetical protein CCYA_CCYA08G2385 [Cyanidiococcus yangmingshanensis]